MVVKFVLLAIMMAVVFASHETHYHDNHHGNYYDVHDDNYNHGHHGYHADHRGGHGHYKHHNHQEYIDYKFKNDVKDDNTYNYQSRDEYKEGKNVYGSYSLVKPNGNVRIVKYKTDGYGFQADVDYKGGYKHDYKTSYENRIYQYRR